MLTKEELLKLSERELARIYRAVVGDGPERIKSGPERERYADEILSKAAETGQSIVAGSSGDEAEPPAEQQENAEPTQETPEVNAKKTKAEAKEAKPRKPREAKPKEAKAPKTTRAAKAPKKKEAKPKEAKKERKPREAKTPRAPRVPKNGADGPFRAGTMKAKGYAVFVKTGGNRNACIDQLLKLGAKPSTASSWYSEYMRTPASK